VPDEVVDARERADGWLDRLHEAGPLDGPVRLLATSELEAARQDSGVSHRIEGPTATALRELRHACLAGDHGDFWYRYLPFTDGDSALHRVYVRDALPHEGPDGLVMVGPTQVATTAVDAPSLAAPSRR
jgi:hypothetical protein